LRGAKAIAPLNAAAPGGPEWINPVTPPVRACAAAANRKGEHRLRALD